MLTVEEWRPIKIFERLYEVSNMGRVRNVKKSNILCGHPDKKGYLRVCLHKDGKQKIFKIHRLVAMAFIPNPSNLPQVNHKDENKANNCVENLEWCNNKYNSNYGTIKERLSALSKKNAVIGTDKDGNIYQFESIKKAADYVGGKAPCISDCCRKIKGRNMAYGYKWKYEDEERNKYYAEQAARNRKTHDKPVIATDKDGNDIFFSSIKEGVEKTGAHRASIIGCCRGKYGRHRAAGYSWRYVNQHNV